MRWHKPFSSDAALPPIQSSWYTLGDWKLMDFHVLICAGNSICWYLWAHRCSRRFYSAYNCEVGWNLSWTSECCPHHGGFHPPQKNGGCIKCYQAWYCVCCKLVCFLKSSHSLTLFILVHFSIIVMYITLEIYKQNGLQSFQISKVCPPMFNSSEKCHRYSHHPAQWHQERGSCESEPSESCYKVEKWCLLVSATRNNIQATVCYLSSWWVACRLFFWSIVMVHRLQGDLMVLVLTGTKDYL